jgi:hypothetical protein
MFVQGCHHVLFMYRPVTRCSVCTGLSHVFFMYRPVITCSLCEGLSPRVSYVQACHYVFRCPVTCIPCAQSFHHVILMSSSLSDQVILVQTCQDVFLIRSPVATCSSCASCNNVFLMYRPVVTCSLRARVAICLSQCIPCLQSCHPIILMFSYMTTCSL